MRRPSPLSRTRRSTSIASVLALHAAAIGLLLTSQWGATDPASPTPAMTLIEIAAEAPIPRAKPPPPPAMPSKVALKAVPPAPPSIAPQDSGTTSTGGGCSTLAAVSAAINGDAEAVSRIRAAPDELRSISGAVVIWNAGWGSGTKLPDEPLEPVRRIIETTLREVEPACLDEQFAGPRLVAIPVGALDNAYAVLGSGNWSWAQMLVPDDVPVIPLPDQVPGAIPWPKSPPREASSPGSNLRIRFQ